MNTPPFPHISQDLSCFLSMFWDGCSPSSAIKLGYLILVAIAFPFFKSLTVYQDLFPGRVRYEEKVFLYNLQSSIRSPTLHWIGDKYRLPCSSNGKESACNAGDQVWSLGWEDPLEKGMAIHSSIVAWRIPWTEGPGGLVHRVTNSWTQLSNWHYYLFSEVIMTQDHATLTGESRYLDQNWGWNPYAPFWLDCYP